MDRKKIYTTFSLVSLISGMLFFAYMHEWIIIRVPHRDEPAQNMAACVHKKMVTFYFWDNGIWQHDAWALCFSDNDHLLNIEYYVRYWLDYLREEGFIDQTINLESVLFSSSNSIAHVSFNQNPLPSQGSILQKWMWIESLLKTLRENGIKLQAVQLLVHHQPLVDDHLDFTNPWPLHGFMK
jgi:hypothetical protein